jgi:hypothetical protein
MLDLQRFVEAINREDDQLLASMTASTQKGNIYGGYHKAINYPMKLNTTVTPPIANTCERRPPTLLPKTTTQNHNNEAGMFTDGSITSDELKGFELIFPYNGRQNVE